MLVPRVKEIYNNNLSEFESYASIVFKKLMQQWEHEETSSIECRFLVSKKNKTKNGNNDKFKPTLSEKVKSIIHSLHILLNSWCDVIFIHNI